MADSIDVDVTTAAAENLEAVSIILQADSVSRKWPQQITSLNFLFTEGRETRLFGGRVDAALHFTPSSTNGDRDISANAHSKTY